MSADDTAAFPANWSAIEAARQPAFTTTIDLACRYHALTRRKMTEAGLRRHDLSTSSDLHRLPITTKAELMAAPADARLDLTAADVTEAERTVWDVMYTTGSSSGRPTPFVSTTSDFWDVLLLQRRMLEIRGVTRADRIANLFPLTTHPHGAFIRVLHAAAALQVPVTSALPGNPGAGFALGQALDGVVETLARTRPTILWGVPSYMRRVVGRAAELGVMLPELRLAFVTGEGLSEPGRDDLLARLAAIGATAARVSVSYGMTEIQGGLVECRAGSGFHNPHPEALRIDVVDPVTHAPVPDGERGLILLSHLRRRGTLLLRYAVGDLGVLRRGACPQCGRVTETIIAGPMRADDLVKIRGMLVNPARAIAAVEGDAGLREFRFLVSRPEVLALDSFVLQIALQPDAPAGTAQTLVARVKDAIGVTPRIEVVTESALIGESWKAKRFVDQRGG